jgi:hypothetical protein
VSLRSALATWIDDSPRYAARREPQFPQTPLPQIRSGQPGRGFGNLRRRPGLPAISEQTAMLSQRGLCLRQSHRRRDFGAAGEHLYGCSPTASASSCTTTILWWVLNEQFLPRWSAAVGGNIWSSRCCCLATARDHHSQGLNGAIDGIDPVHPIATTVLATPDYMRLVYAVRRPTGALEVYDQDDVLHIPGFGFNGFRGLSPLRNHLRMTRRGRACDAGICRALLRQRRAFRHLHQDRPEADARASAGHPRHVDGASTRASATRTVRRCSATDVKALTLPLEDAQLLETRRFQIEEIARIYGVPPFMIGQMDKTTSWGSGVETMGKGFVRFTLRQHLTKFEKEINRKFFRTAASSSNSTRSSSSRPTWRRCSPPSAWRSAARAPGFMTAEPRSATGSTCRASPRTAPSAAPPKGTGTQRKKPKPHEPQAA